MSQKIEEVQEKIKTAASDLLEEIDRNYLRDVQKLMFNCSAQCCEDKFASRKSVDNCIERCNVDLRRTEKTLEKELEDFQSQLSRCTMTVYDKQIQKYGPNPNSYKPDQVAQFTEGLEKGILICADQHISLLPKIKERIISSLGKWS